MRKKKKKKGGFNFFPFALVEALGTELDRGEIVQKESVWRKYRTTERKDYPVIVNQITDGCRTFLPARVGESGRNPWVREGTRLI